MLFRSIVKIEFFFFQFSISNYCIRCNILSSSLDPDKLGFMVVFFFFLEQEVSGYVVNSSIRKHVVQSELRFL